jgi:hypothetical protein
MILNKAPRRKRRGIKCALQAAGFQPAYAPRGEKLNPVEINGNYKRLQGFAINERLTDFLNLPSIP